MMHRPRQQTLSEEDIVYRSILHIGDESVRALVVEIRPESTLIIGAGQEPRMDIGPTIKASALASVCEDALRQAEDATKEAIGYLVVPDEAIVGVPESCIYCVTGGVQTQRPQPEKEIQRSEFLHLLTRLYNATEKLAAAASAQDSGPAPSLELLDAEITEIRIDGHPVTTPLRFRGSKLEASAVALFAESAFMDEVRRLMSYLELTPIPVAIPWAIASSAQTALANEPEAIILILDRHETILLLSRRRTVIALERCASGSEELARDLAVALGLPRFRADVLQEAYRRGELDDSVADWVESGALYSVRQWLQSLTEALSRIAEQGPLPARLCLWELGPSFPALERIVRAWMETWPLDRFPTVQRLTARDIPGISERTGTLSDDPAEATVLALAHYAGRLQAERVASEQAGYILRRRRSFPADALLRRVAGNPAHRA